MSHVNTFPLLLKIFIKETVPNLPCGIWFALGDETDG